MNRTIDNDLRLWAVESDRNVLLPRGARQIGKTYTARFLGKAFKYFVEINFEEMPSVCSFFGGDLTPQPICEKLSGFLGKPIRPGETLLFFDEIQACPNCLRALRFFKEQMPQLHVIAAGSLIEFALSELPSYGVGRLTSLFMNPLSFFEFVEAVEWQSLAEYLRALTVAQPVDLPFHEKFLDLLRVYMLIGGLPAVVNVYKPPVPRPDAQPPLCPAMLKCLFSAPFAYYLGFKCMVDECEMVKKSGWNYALLSNSRKCMILHETCSP